MSARKKIIISVIFLFIMFCCEGVFANNNYIPTITIDNAAGDNSLQQLDYLQPLFSPTNQILFLDARTNDTFDTAKGYAFGLGYRDLYHQQAIFGLYGFIEHEVSFNDQWFYQGNLGLELLSNVADFRMNGYIPFEKEQLTSSYIGLPTNQVPFLGNKIILQNYLNEDQSMPGLDGEVGLHVPKIAKLKLFLGYYYYGFQNNTENIEGPRARLEYQLNPNITLTAADRYDHEFGNQILLGVRFALGNIPDTNNDLSQRLHSYIINQPYVMSQINTKPGPFIYSSQNIYFVNNANPSSGNGTYQSPFQTFQQAAAAASQDNNQDIIYVEQGNNSYQLNGVVTLPSYLTLLTSASNFTYDGFSLIQGNPSAIPTLIGGLVLGNNDSLNDFSLDNFKNSNISDGISGTDVNNILIHGVFFDPDNTDNAGFLHSIVLIGDGQNENVNINNSVINENKVLSLNSTLYGIEISGYNNINLTNDYLNINDQANLAGQTAITNGISISNASNVNLNQIAINSESIAPYSGAYGVALYNCNNCYLNNIVAIVSGSDAAGIFASGGENLSINNSFLLTSGIVSTGISLNNQINANLNNDDVILNGYLVSNGIFLNNSQNILISNADIKEDESWPFTYNAIFATNNSSATINNYQNIVGTVIADNLGNNQITFKNSTIGPNQNGILNSGQSMMLGS